MSSYDRMYNAQDKDGQTPLMVAVTKQNLYALKHLMGKNADVAIVDNHLNNVFHHAASSSKDTIEVDSGDFY